MIVLKHNDAIYVAKSCWALRDPQARKTGVPDVENLSMWHPNRKKNRLMALSGCARFIDAIRYENIFPAVLNPKHLVFQSYEKASAIADRFDLRREARLPGKIIFAEGDTAYALHPEGAYIEIEDIYVCGCEDEVMMALYDLKGVKDPYEFFREAFRAIEDIQKYAMFPVTVMNTKNNEIEVIYR